MTRAKDISKIVTDADLSGTLDVTGTVTAGAINVAGASGAEITITDNSPSTVSLYMGAGNSSVSIGSTTSDPVTFLTANTERMRIDSSGNVGIATSSPVNFGAGTAGLTINGSASHITWQNSGTNVAFAYNVGNNFLIGSEQAGSSTIFTSAGSERMRIDSSGNVGIGTSSPSSPLNIIGNATTTDLATRGVHLHDPITTDEDILPITFTFTSTANRARAGIGGISRSSDAVAGYGGAIGFYTRSAADASALSSSDERMRITESGNVGIGTSSPSTPLDVGGHIRVTGGNDCDIEFQSGSARRKFIGGDGNELELGTFSSSNTSRDVKMTIDSTGHTSISADKSGGYALGIVNDGNNSDRYGISIQCGSDSGSGTNYLMGFKDGDGNSVGSITFSGSSSSYNTSSDHRLKENVIADWDATTRLKQLNPVRFNFIAHADTTVDGFLAHEVQSVVPEAITGTHNEVDADGNPVYQGIDQSKLVPLLVKTIQELEARIVALETA
jgi:hypothetical protein